MRRHRPAGGMTEGDDLLSGQKRIGEQARTLQNDVEGTFQIAIRDFVLRQIAVLEVNRIALWYGLLPDAAQGVMTRIGECQDLKSLRRHNTREARSAVGRQIHNLFAARAAVKEYKRPAWVGLLFRRVNRAVHVPVVAVAMITGPSVGGCQTGAVVRRIDRKPFIPGELQ